MEGLIVKEEGLLITLIVLMNSLTKDWRIVIPLEREKECRLEERWIGGECFLVKAMVLIITGIDPILYRSEFVIYNSRCDL